MHPKLPLPLAAILVATLALTGCSGLIPTPTDLSNIQEVDRLCAKDGGIRVYEQVTLPASLFTLDGLPNAKKLEGEYVFESSMTLISREGERAIQRTHASVKRKADGKQLGEAIKYAISYGSEHVSVPFYKVHSCDGFGGNIAPYALWPKVFVQSKGSVQ